MLFRSLKSLLCVVLFSAGLPLAHAQTVISASPATISTSGSYVLGNPITGLSITANNVTLDLAGFNVSQNPGTVVNCAITVGTRGNSCSSTTSGTVAMSITGSNVVVRNGFVSSGLSHGISITAGLNSNSNVLIDGVSVSNFRGNGIQINGGNVSLSNVQVTQVGNTGILGTTGNVRMKNVTSNYNNGLGMQLNVHGILEEVSADYNTSWGIQSVGPIIGASAAYNGGVGIFNAGSVRDALAIGNVSDGIVATGGFGLIVDSTATQNSGNGFTMNSHTCYSRLSAAGNALVAVSGGTALTGSVASCN